MEISFMTVTNGRLLADTGGIVGPVELSGEVWAPRLSPNVG